MSRFDRRIGSLEQFADAQASVGRLDDVRRIRRVSNSTQLRTGEHLIVEAPSSGDTIIVRMPAFSPGRLGIESRIAVRGSGSVSLAPPPGFKVNGVTDLALTVTSTRAATVMMEDKGNYFAIQNTLDTDTDTDTKQVYVDRGGVVAAGAGGAGFDFVIGDFTKSSSTYYAQDWSSVTGAAEQLVHFRAQIQGSTSGRLLVLRHPRGTNSYITAYTQNLIGANLMEGSGWVLTNSTGHVEYRVDPNITACNIIIRGWMEDQ